MRISDWSSDVCSSDLFAARGRRFLPSITRRPKKLNGFKLDRGRLALPYDSFFAEDPVRLIEMFALADRHQLEIHPLAMRAASRDVNLIDNDIRNDERANALFLEVLTSRSEERRVGKEFVSRCRYRWSAYP